MMRILLCVVLILTFMSCNGRGVGQARGKKIGRIVRLSEEGRWCKTYEGELVRGGLNNGSGVMGAPFHFTLISEEHFKEMNQIMQQGYEIEVDYMKGSITGGCAPSTESEGFVTGFRILTPEGEKESRRRQLLKELEDLSK